MTRPSTELESEAVPDVERSRFGQNARLLTLSSITCAGLGILYWMAAEWFFPTAEVGRASVAVSTATMLGTLSCLSLGGMYERFLTSAGHRARAMIGTGILLVGVTALAVGGLFLFTGQADTLLPTVQQKALFPAVVMVFAIFALADPILVGLRNGAVLAVKNISHAVVKLAILPCVAGGSALAIYGTWAGLCAVASAAALSWAFIRGVQPLSGRETKLPPMRSLVSHHGAMFTMMLGSLVLPLYLPLVVLRDAGAEAAAYFGISQVLTTGAAMLLAAVHSSYVAEAGHPDSDTAAATRRMGSASAVIAVVCAVGLAAVGPLILGLVGPAYRDNASLHLTFMACAIIPQAFIGFYAVLSRTRNRMRILMIVQILQVILVVLAVPYGLRRWDLTGVGLTFLAAELLCAGLIAVPALRAWRALSSENSQP